MSGRVVQGSKKLAGKMVKNGSIKHQRRPPAVGPLGQLAGLVHEGGLGGLGGQARISGWVVPRCGTPRW